MVTRQEAEKYLEKYIPSSKSGHFPATLGLKRAAYLTKILDNPQENYRTIHIAGTSGKGTTAYIAMRLLQANGIKTGLHLSPHLLDIRERMMVNGKFITDKNFLLYLKTVLQAAERCEKEFSRPTYFEVLTALAMYTFSEEKVDAAIIETGMGGTFDATNVITRPDKIAVITRIGHDHTNILGKTLPEIATQKAGIIQKNNSVITLDSKRTNKVFEARAQEKNATLTLLGTKNVQNKHLTNSGVNFDFSFQNVYLKNLTLALLGLHQAENTALALAACTQITDINNQKTRNTLQKIRFKGRVDRVTRNGETIIIDGAHNSQKMKALVATLKELYPSKKFTIVLAIKKGKAVKSMLTLLKPITQILITTTFFKNTHDLVHIAYNEKILAQKATSLGFETVLTEPTADEAIKKALTYSSPVVVTGSLYYLQDIYAYLEN